MAAEAPADGGDDGGDEEEDECDNGGSCWCKCVASFFSSLSCDKMPCCKHGNGGYWLAVSAGLLGQQPLQPGPWQSARDSASCQRHGWH
jgi:hypothetical protein